MTRRNPKNPPKQLPPKKDENPEEDDVIIPDIVESQPQLVNPQVIQIFVERDKTGELEKFLDSVVSYNERRLAVIREHVEKHPDAIESRNTRKSRRFQYIALLLLACLLLVSMPFVALAVAGIFGMIATLIICGILVNARERELDLQGFIRLINIVIGKQK